MGAYLAHFSVYTFAMVGFLFVAVMIYKKTCVNGFNGGNKGEMSVEDSLSLSPRKKLHVVRVNGEKFLIAADVERTEFLAKLDSGEEKTSLNGFTAVPTTLGNGSLTQLPQNNVISLNKHPKLLSGLDKKLGSKVEGKVASILKNIEKRNASLTQTQGSMALKPQQKAVSDTRLNHVKNISMKKQPMMRAILSKLEA